MLNIKEINRYFVRLSKLAERPDLTGQVVYLRHVSQDGIVVSPTNDCRPLPIMISLSAGANDNGWYDATELVLDANCAITPRYDMCAFVNETAKEYRNHIEDVAALKVCKGKEAAGRLCFIGKEQDGQMVFSQTAYFVVSQDEHGFYIAYSGFCNPKSDRSNREILQRVLRLEGTGQMFFDAVPLVHACNTAYQSDVVTKDKYVSDLRDRVAASSIRTTQVASQRDGALSDLHLGRPRK